MNPVDSYAEDVVAGRIPAGTYHRLSCARHLRDRAREGTAGFPYRFDVTKAERFFKFAAQLRHYQGEWAGQPITLTPYQQFRLGAIFGWMHAETGLRRFRKAYNEVPRKSGKSLEAAVVAVYVTFFDGEPGAEGYTSATKRDQAQIVFRAAKKLVQSSGLKSRIVVQVANMHSDRTASKLEPLSADYNSMDGLNPHLVIVDEFHAHKDRGVIDVLETAMGARRQPLMFEITTAGDDPVSPCGDEHDYACKILDRVIEDETFFAFMAHADPSDDWLSETTWKKANPHYGISVKPDDMRALATKAKHMPAAVAEFKQKRLNLWVNTQAPCLSMDGWAKGQSHWDPAEMEHESCYVGIDLASKLDLCAVTLLFPPAAGRPRFRLLQYILTPEETLLERARHDRAPYDIWVEQGWLIAAPGTSVDHELIRDIILQARQRFDIEYVGYDNWHADQLAKRLVKDGFAEEQVIEVPQTFQGLSAAELRFKGEVLAGNVDARGCPVTKWAASNVVEQKDGKDNIQFTKKRSRGRIDPIKSATIAMVPWLRQGERQEKQYQVFILGGHHA